MRLVELRRRLLPVSLAAAVFSGAGGALLGTCGPFTDVAADAFCPVVLEIFTIGITTGTTATTYDPTGNVTRLQMAAFLSRTVDGVLKRGSRRAALRQFWTPLNFGALGGRFVGVSPFLVESDGTDLWVPNGGDGTVMRLRGSDSSLIQTFTGAENPVGVVMARSYVFVTGNTSPGKLYSIDPTFPTGSVSLVGSNLGAHPLQIAFDGTSLWTANAGPPGSVSMLLLGSGFTTVTAGFSGLNGILFDGSNIWVTDTGAGKLLKLDQSASILQTVTVGAVPEYPVFDGSNIWVPNYGSNSVSVVRASSGAVLATLTGNGLGGPRTAAFDGQRILITNYLGDTVSIWKASDLTTIGSNLVAAGPYGACSDGISFWITSVGNGVGPGTLTRF